jgi:hypothetical protein
MLLIFMVAWEGGPARQDGGAGFGVAEMGRQVPGEHGEQLRQHAVAHAAHALLGDAGQVRRQQHVRQAAAVAMRSGSGWVSNTSSARAAESPGAQRLDHAELRRRPARAPR